MSIKTAISTGTFEGTGGVNRFNVGRARLAMKAEVFGDGRERAMAVPYATRVMRWCARARGCTVLREINYALRGGGTLGAAASRYHVR